MRIALVLDWLDKYGGAERVVSVLNKKYNFYHSYTLINNMLDRDLQKIYSKKPKISTTVLQFTGRFFRAFFPFFFLLINRIKVDKNVDLIISSSHCVAKGVKKSRKEQIHFSYFQARNFKYIWEEAPIYFGRITFFIQPLLALLRKIDKKQANQPDYIIVNSEFVKEWVRKNYGRDSIVIHPPVDLRRFQLSNEKEDYYVAVGRLVEYKRFDVIVEAFNINNKKLIIIGDGKMRKNLERISKDNIVFTGFLESEEVNKYIAKAKGFIHAGLEDFGIAPVEAQACGTPILAFKAGGALETVIENKTGVFFTEQTPLALNIAISKFEQIEFDPIIIRENSLRFSESNFLDKIDHFIKEKISLIP